MFFKVDLIKLQIAPCFTGKYVDIHIISSSLGPARALAGRGTVAGPSQNSLTYLCLDESKISQNRVNPKQNRKSFWATYPPYIYIYIYICVWWGHIIT